MSAEKSAGASWRGGFRHLVRVPRCEDRVLDRAFRWDLAIRHRKTMPKSHPQPKSIEAQMESSDSEERDQADTPPVPQEEEPTPEAGENVESAQSDEWWRASEPAPDWTQPSTDATETEVVPTKEPSTADVYFCGHTSLFPLSRALRAIANERLTGVLRAFWEQEPIELLARDGESVFVTTRDPDLYCPEVPDVLANVDVVVVERSREQQRESGTPFFLNLAREECIALDAATELMRQYGQKLFSELWTAPRAWIMFEKNPDLLSNVADVPGDPNVRDWALETLRLVQNPDQPPSFDPASIPAYTKDGFERVQKLKLTADEAQFASQFNGVRSVQQIAKNLRLDLKSTQQLLF